MEGILWTIYGIKYLALVMVLAAVKIVNSKVFQKILNSKILPRPDIVYKEYNFVLNQDITTPHTSRLTVSRMTNLQYVGLKIVWDCRNRSL